MGVADTGFDPDALMKDTNLAMIKETSNTSGLTSKMSDPPHEDILDDLNQEQAQDMT
jgi:hypothetical protein